MLAKTDIRANIAGSTNENRRRPRLFVLNALFSLPACAEVRRCIA